VLGAVWLWAGFSKVGDPRAFTQTVRAYDATPEWLSKAIGYGLPVLEICLGVVLVVGVMVRIAAAVSAVLVLVFLVGLIQAAIRGIKLECGCFGGGGVTDGATSYTLDILRDVGLLIIAVYLVLWAATRLGLDEFLARNDEVEMPSAKRLRTDNGLRKYNALVDARRKQARDRTLYLTSALGIVIVLVSVIGIGVQAGRAKISGDLTATNATVSTGVTVGKAGAPVTVQVFEDFQCPVCEQFETSAGADLAAQAAAGKILVQYHPIAILDASSNGNQYSSRAANAALCASDISVAAFQKYHAILYGKDSKGQPVQPDEGSNGRTDVDLVNYGTQAGFKDDPAVESSASAIEASGGSPANDGANATDFKICVQSEKHKALVEAMTDNASKRGITSTPTVIVNGKKIPGVANKASLDAAITAAAKAAPVKSSTPGSAPVTGGGTTGTAPVPTSTVSAPASGS
jgi:protein-disulfide isomerase/uncharacterized membrane protein YphA (DoxX/SURF4 family)